MYERKKPTMIMRAAGARNFGLFWTILGVLLINLYPPPRGTWVNFENLVIKTDIQENAINLYG